MRRHPSPEGLGEAEFGLPYVGVFPAVGGDDRSRNPGLDGRFLTTGVADRRRTGWPLRIRPALISGLWAHRADRPRRAVRTSNRAQPR